MLAWYQMTKSCFLRNICNYFVPKRFQSIMADSYESGLAYIDVKGNCNPLDLFKEWLEEAKTYGRFKTAFFNLATCNKSGDVSSRTVVLREFKSNGFVFVTNGNSKKIEQIKENPKVSACFFWSYKKDEKFIHRQIRVEGSVEQLSFEECEKYHEKEPLYCQIRSHICQQGQKVDWNELKKRHDELLEEVKTSKKQLKMPEYQVAYVIVPSMLDFYFAWNNNIADRLLFTKHCENGWTFDRVAA